MAAAYLLALPVGWNGEKEERSAGLRTFPLVAVAACGFVQAAESLTVGEPEAMARIIEGIITGMGFIGGGAILRLKDSVKGTATAASLWGTVRATLPQPLFAALATLPGAGCETENLGLDAAALERPRQYVRRNRRDRDRPAAHRT